MQAALSSQIANPDRLRALYRLCLLDSPANPAFDRLTRLASRILPVPTSLVSLVDIDHQFYKSFVGVAEPWATTRETPLSHSFCKHVIDSGEPLIVEDAREHELVKNNPAIAEMNVIAYAGFPLFTSDHQTLGTFCVVDAKPRRWTPADLQILEELAAAAMVEIELRSEIIEREKLQRHLEETRKQLEDSIQMMREADSLRSRFISMAAHEFRTPLAVINLASSLMFSARLDTPERQAQNYERIQLSIEKMTELLDDVLHMGKAEAGRANFNPQPVDVEVLCRDIIETVGAADTKGQPIRFTREGKAGTIAHIDVRYFQSILQNLLVNAAKYSSRTAEIEVTLTFEPEQMTLQVRDHGIGIPPEDQKRLFEPFYRAGNVGKTQGTGLGLAIVKSAVDLHSGTIQVESVSGAGTTFTITLPLTP
jgi:signal transduction histidine kinase